MYDTDWTISNQVKFGCVIKIFCFFESNKTLHFCANAYPLIKIRSIFSERAFCVEVFSFCNRKVKSDRIFI